MTEEMQSVSPVITEPVLPPVVPPTPISPTIPTPKKSPWALILSLLLVATLATAGYFYWQNTQLKSQLAKLPSPKPTVSPSSTPIASNTATPTSPDEPKTILDTSTWQKYSKSDFLYSNNIYKSYSLLFPPSCTQEVSTINCSLTHGMVTIMINVGGHGGEPGNYKTLKSNEPKIIPLGSGLISSFLNLDTNLVDGTFWINKTAFLTQEPVFGFEFTHIPYQDLAEFEKLFDDVLSTLTFTKI